MVNSHRVHGITRRPGRVSLSNAEREPSGTPFYGVFGFSSTGVAVPLAMAAWASMPC